MPGESPGNNTGMDSHSLLQGIFPLPDSEIELGSPALQVDSLPSEPAANP